MYSLVRLEGLTNEITGHYAKFDEWRKDCDAMDGGLLQSEAAIKNEEPIGNDIETVERKLEENEVNTATIEPFCPEFKADYLAVCQAKQAPQGTAEIRFFTLRSPRF